MTTPTAGGLVHRPVRAYPRPLPAADLTVAAPPTVGRAAAGAAGWLQYLVPLAGGGGSVAFLFAVPGPRPLWLVALIAGAVVASVAAGVGLRLVERRAAGRARRRDRSRYLAHLRQVASTADHLAAAQLATAEHVHPDPPALWPIVTRTDRLWERRRPDTDFLTVRVGRGPVPLASQAHIDTVGDPLAEHDPDLLEAAEEVVRRTAWLPGTPVVVPLRELTVLALTGPPAATRALARSVVCQAAVFHAPDDLRVQVPHPPTARAAWDWTRWLPHTRDPTTVGGHAQAGPGPHRLVVVDRTEPSLGASLPVAAGPGVTVIWLAETTAGEPSEVSMRVRLDDQGVATLLETTPGGRRVTGVRADTADLALCEALARRLAPLRLERPPPTGPGAGPVRLLDLLDLTERRADRPALSRSELLRVPMGVTAAGDRVVLDLKEAAEHGIGPHGLVVGATGSGKSELLRTIVAGLAATHPPEQLAFVLVDFKGGAAFAGLARLPQVAGLITNLQTDLSMVDRALAALQGELARRQRLLHLAGNQPDLRAYTARRAADPRLEPLPSLLIVVDEFGELLAARPEFLDLLGAIGRVGRSLGMHLLLASQRLDEGRLRGLDSHLRFRICLRTFSATDSTAVLGVPDAYHLPAAPGSALIQADASAPVPFTAAVVASARPDPTQAGRPADLEVVTGPLAGAGQPVHQVWLPPLAAAIGLGPLVRAAAPGWLRIPVGVVDRPLDQAQEPLVLDLSGSAGHLAVVGAPRTGKSTLLCTLVAALAATHPPDEVQVYAVDLGGGLLHRLSDLPHVGAVCAARDAERARRLLRELHALVLERERRFRDLGIDSMASWHELRRNGLDLGDYGEVFLLLDNWAGFVRELPELEPEVTELAASGMHYGVHVVVTANRWAELRPGLRENLGGRLELRLNAPLESELGRPAAAALPELPGRGLTQAGLQFQAALPGTPQAVLDRATTSRSGAVAPPLRLLPTLVRESVLDPCPVGAGTPSGFPFGVEEQRLDLVHLDLFRGAPHLLVLGDAGCGKTSLLRLVARQLAARHAAEEVTLLVVDLCRRLLDLTGLPILAGYASTPAAVGQVVEHLHRQLTVRAPTGLDLPPGPWLAAWEPDRMLMGSGTGSAGNGSAGNGSGGTPAAPGAPQRPGVRPGLVAAPIRAGPTLAGPRVVLLVDDYDLLPASAGSPLLPLLDLLGLGGELGFHLVLARRVAGAARAAFEPVYQRLRELGGPGLVMSGDPGEGPLLGGLKAAPMPPGRGRLLQPGRPPTLVQVAYSPAPRAGGARPEGRLGEEQIRRPGR
jgi:S-DNA-T family DNA segregation ATPase FtsK/SpoIIIE